MQKMIIAESRYSFESQVSQYLDKGWKFVPHSLQINSAHISGSTSMESDMIYIVFLEKSNG